MSKKKNPTVEEIAAAIRDGTFYNKVTTCKHTIFDASITVARFEDREPFMAEISINCAECKKPFQFLGLEPGIDFNGARVSIDGLKAGIAICAQGERPSPLQSMSFGVKRFDG
jgi:hypothetical protein